MAALLPKQLSGCKALESSCSMPSGGMIAAGSTHGLQAASEQRCEAAVRRAAHCRHRRRQQSPWPSPGCPYSPGNLLTILYLLHLILHCPQVHALLQCAGYQPLHIRAQPDEKVFSMQETATGEASAKTNKANGKAQGNRRNRPDDAIVADILRHIADFQDAKVLSLCSTVCLQTDALGCSAHLNHHKQLQALHANLASRVCHSRRHQ